MLTCMYTITIKSVFSSVLFLDFESMLFIKWVMGKVPSTKVFFGANLIHFNAVISCIQFSYIIYSNYGSCGELKVQFKPIFNFVALHNPSGLQKYLYLNGWKPLELVRNYLSKNKLGSYQTQVRIAFCNNLFTFKVK